MMDELDRARYVSLTTFKQDGAPVATPVWITGSSGAYAFTTGAQTWKARRLGRNPGVEVRVCDLRGRVRSGATAYVGTGAVDGGADAVVVVERALAAKYGWQFRATKLFDRTSRWLRRRPREDLVVIRIALSSPE